MIIEVLNVEDFKASIIKSTKNRPRIGSVFFNSKPNEDVRLTYTIETL